MTRSRTPASSALGDVRRAPRRRATPRRRGRSRPKAGGVVAAAVGPAEDADRVRPRSRGVGATARPRPPSPRIVMVCMSSVPHFAWWRAAMVRRTQKSRGHRRGAAAPGVSVPWRPRFVVSDAPSRAPGPVPPGRAARASSSTLRRRCGGSCANHTHNPNFMQPFPAGLAGPLARWYTSPVPRTLIVPDAGTPGQPAASAGRARARPRAGSAVVSSSGSPRSSG